MARPLDGVTVVSVEQAVAAPFATRQLADLGARVIKVERPDGGDFARHYDARVKGQSSYFVWLNRSKESLTLNLKHPDGRQVLEDLLDRADVFIHNLAPSAADRLELGVEQVRRQRPGLIACAISGYGAGGPRRDAKAYDLLIQGETGVLSVTGYPDAQAKVGISVADIAAGMYTFSAVLSSLYARTGSGVGAAHEVSLFDALSEWMSHPMYYTMYTGVPPARTGTSHASIAPYGTFTTGGSPLQLAIQNQREWRRFCETVLERPTLAGDERFATNELRVANAAALQVEIETVFHELGEATTRARLVAADIATATVNDVAGLLDHPELAARARWTEVDSPGGPIRALKPPATARDSEPRMDPIPALGEHTEEVLRWVGRSSDQIDRLRQAGVL